VSTPPTGPQDRPQDQSNQPGYGQPGYNQPGQYPPGQPGQQPPGQPGNFGLQQYNPTQQGYTPYSQSFGGQGGYGYAPPGQLAGWPIRVGASLLDSLIPILPMIIGSIAALAVSSSGDPGTSDKLGTAGGVLLVGGYLVGVVLAFWNRVIRQGRTGQSIGKKLTGLKIVSETTGETIGIGRTFGREVCSVIFNYICFLDVLWPLWDQKQQTWHDKVVSDLVIKL
jgi:uncharacterized RDD family membrane protein YckC